MTSCGRPTLADLAMCDALHAWATAHGTEAAAFEDPLEAYRDFRGRDAEITPLLARRGLTA